MQFETAEQECSTESRSAVAMLSLSAETIFTLVPFPFQVNGEIEWAQVKLSGSVGLSLMTFFVQSAASINGVHSRNISVDSTCSISMTVFAFHGKAKEYYIS